MTYAVALASPPTHPRQVRTGLGSVPADFDAVIKRVGGLGSAASNLARWEAYAAAHMYDPSAKL